MQHKIEDPNTDTGERTPDVASNTVSAFAQPSMWGAEVEVLLQCGYNRTATEISFKSLAPGESAVGPSFVMSRSGAQRLLDDLWATGLRPTIAKDETGALAAAQAHIGDLREILQFNHTLQRDFMQVALDARSKRLEK